MYCLSSFDPLREHPSTDLSHSPLSTAYPGPVDVPLTRIVALVSRMLSVGRDTVATARIEPSRAAMLVNTLVR